MWVNLQRYAAIAFLGSLLSLGAFAGGCLHGQNKQRNSDAKIELELQKKYNAKLLINTSIIQDIQERYSKVTVDIAMSNIKSKEDLIRDKDFINKHTIISNVFVRGASPKSLSSSSHNSQKLIIQSRTISESATISQPYRVAEWSRGITIAQWECVAQLNALIDVINLTK